MKIPLQKMYIIIVFSKIPLRMEIVQSTNNRMYSDTLMKIIDIFDDQDIGNMAIILHSLRKRTTSFCTY